MGRTEHELIAPGVCHGCHCAWMAQGLYGARLGWCRPSDDNQGRDWSAFRVGYENRQAFLL